ncbi:hypothetical protein BG011_009194 [Mortierella polycephala]|uniref:Uncharacterized protein n=1 Tax=Mortierella polycephala TaxID=41804 RepID=A0A9P6PP86_9FUNG|nr:hypothetical protein BG011_009194 [Mortierella polycephala]
MGLTKTYKDGSTPVVAIIGAGFSGLCAAIRLQTQLNLHTYTMFELEPELGGTWFANSYPGCACDVASINYQFSFEPNYEWSHRFAPQPEIWAYLRRVAKKYNLHEKIQFRTEIVHVEWNQDRQKWVLDYINLATNEKGVLEADIVFSGMGPLRIPQIPKQFENFEGPMWHTAQWNHSIDLTNKRVAVVGSGASNKLIHRLPRAIASFMAWTYRFIQIRDKALRAKLTPDYEMGCRRIVISSNYFPALAKKNVNVHTETITAVKGNSLMLKDGSVQEVDALVLATGFKVQEMIPPKFVIGKDGVDLIGAWGKNPSTFYGVTSSHTPNMFFLLGPNTGLGHNSVLFMIETQVEYAIKAMSYMMENNLSTIQVTEKACNDFVTDLDEKMKDKVWSSTCQSWYQNDEGRVTALWWGSCSQYSRRMKNFHPQCFINTPRKV